jgi:hypothetical protein
LECMRIMIEGKGRCAMLLSKSMTFEAIIVKEDLKLKTFK